MNFQQRNELITRLERSKWEIVPATPSGKWLHLRPGWTMKHEDGFVLWFDSRGQFRLDLDGNMLHIGVATEPAHILDLINAEAAKL
jgi:hypothetical protein